MAGFLRNLIGGRKPEEDPSGHIREKVSEKVLGTKTSNAIKNRRQQECAAVGGVWRNGKCQ